MNVRGLLRFYERGASLGKSLVLVTVYETRGSTYSKAGALMLLDTEGSFHGMLSGGCLEGDLALRAAEVVESNRAMTVTYDLAQDDELWGLGVGCDGVMQVLLQPLKADTGYEPFASISAALQGDEPRRFVLVIESASESIPAGAAAIEEGERMRGIGLDVDLGKPAAGTTTLQIEGDDVTVLQTVLRPPPRVLVLGAGKDAEPVIRIAAELGWRCTVVDHRESYIRDGDFGNAEELVCKPADQLQSTVDLSSFDAAIVMSHHLVSDRSYLRQLAASDVAYVGLLGPRARRDRLLRELGEEGASLETRVHGPAGLDLGGRGPAAIALSIVAEIQGVLEDAAG